MSMIRNVEEKDRKAIENICLATASEELRKTESSRKFTLQLYNRYYTRMAKKHSFVSVDTDGKIEGYILCAPHFDTFYREFMRKEGKEIFKKSFSKGIYALGSLLLQKPFAKQYPAHLHIDILEEYQNKGLGKKLMHTLKAHLKDMNCKGIFLVVGKENHRAVAFYQKQDFHILKKLGGAYLMGCSL